MTLSYSSDIERIGLQEQLLRFQAFGQQSAWEVGVALKARCEERGLSVTIEIRIARETVFLYAMPGAKPENADWARRKRNTVEMTGRSSYGVGLALKEQGETLQSLMGLERRDYASHGGAFPILHVEGGCLGVVTVSGLPERDDHALVVEELAHVLGVSHQDVSFEEPASVGA